MSELDPQSILKSLFTSAVQAASPDVCLSSHLSQIDHRKIHVLGAGKAAAAMAKTVEDNFDGKVTGTVITRYGHSVPTQFIEVVEAAHPLPDEIGVRAAKRILAEASKLDEQDLAVCLISGGASSLLSLPHEKVNHQQKRNITEQLLLCGANIHEINCVRKHLSAIKGGQLMRNIYPARALTFCISDVAGDDPATIGSGPTVADSSSCGDVLEILSRYKIETPSNIVTMLNNRELETPKPGEEVFTQSNVKVVATSKNSLKASADEAARVGIEAIIVDDSIEGNTSQVARRLAIHTKTYLTQHCLRKPFVLISGGEATVKVMGSGTGGPNTQLALTLALQLQQTAGIYAIVCDTDGIDGSGHNAGAIVTPCTLKRAQERNLDPYKFIADNNAFEFFKQLDDLVVCGPTLTNVNDFRAILWMPQSP